MNAKNALYVAIREILPDNNIEDITVEDILRKADVSRATFYKYFKDKYDLATSFYRDTFIDSFIPPKKTYDKYDIRREQMALIKENKDFLKSLLKYKGPNSFFEFIEQYFFMKYYEIHGNEFDNTQWPAEKRLEMGFYVAGMVKVFEIWVLNDCEDPEAFFEVNKKLLPEEFWQW